MTTAAALAHSLRAMHAAARPCGTSEDGRTVLAIHADALEELLRHPSHNDEEPTT